MDYRIWVALVVIGIIAIGGYLYPKMGGNILAGSTSCGSITCLEGGLRLVSDVGGDFESDVAAVFNSTITSSGAVALTSTFKLGTSGTAQSNQITTTCSMTANTSIAATSSGYAFCTGVTGVTSSDNIIATFASSTGGLAITDDWVIIGAKASTTAGAIDFQILNLTGTARATSAASRIGSTTSIVASH